MASNKDDERRYVLVTGLCADVEDEVIRLLDRGYVLAGSPTELNGNIVQPMILKDQPQPPQPLTSGSGLIKVCEDTAVFFLTFGKYHHYGVRPGSTLHFGQIVGRNPSFTVAKSGLNYYVLETKAITIEREP